MINKDDLDYALTKFGNGLGSNFINAEYVSKKNADEIAASNLTQVVCNRAYMNSNLDFNKIMSIYKHIYKEISKD